MSSKAAKRALYVLAVAYVVAFASGGIQLPLTSTAMHNVGLSMSAVGLMWAVRSVLAIFGPALWGAFADRHGDARPFAVASLASGALLLVALSMTTSAAPAIIIFGFYGLLCGPSGSLLDGMVLTALGDEKQRFGRWRMWGTVGFGVTSFGAAILIDRHMLEAVPRVLFPICAALTFAGAVALLFVPRLERPALARFRDVVPFLKRPDMIALFCTSTLLWCSHSAYATFITPLATSRGLPEWCVGGSLLSAIVVEVLMLRYASFFLVRFPARQLLVFVCALSVVRWTATAFIVDPILFIALNALHGITFGLFFATLVAMVAQRTPPEMRQAAQGTVGSSSFGLGGGLGALLAGNVLHYYDAATTWAASAVVAAIALAVAWRFVR